MGTVKHTPGPLHQPSPDVTSSNGARHPGWFARLRELWLGRTSHALSPANGPAPALLTSPDLTAFVLLGGGARGAAQAGAIAVVMEHGVRPDVIIGVSAGAWNGAFLAVDPTPERAKRLCDIWAGLKNSDLLGGGWWRAAVSAVSGQASLYGSEGPLEVAHRYLDKHLFEELKTPLYILATNLTTAQPKLFSSGPLLPAVLSSSAVPGIFPPMALDGHVYVDGGLLEWDACAAALRLGAQKIYLFGCGSVGELSPRLSRPSEGDKRGLSNGNLLSLATSNHRELGPKVGANLLEVLERSWDVVSQYQFKRAVEVLRASGADVVSIEPMLPLLSRPLDFNRSETVIAAGRAAAEEALKLGAAASSAAADEVASGDSALPHVKLAG